MKICTKCKIPQPLGNFCNNKLKKDGKNHACKSCCNIYKKQHRKENKEIISLQAKRWYEKNKENILLKHKQWNNTHKEQISLKHKQWHINNREHALTKTKEYYENNRKNIYIVKKQYRKTSHGKAITKLQGRNAKHKRRVITKQGDVTTAQLKELLDNSTHCFYCNDPLIYNEIHIDHYIPLAKGGLHTVSNLRVACKKCNLQKGKKMPEEFSVTKDSTHENKYSVLTISSYQEVKGTYQ